MLAMLHREKINLYAQPGPGVFYYRAPNDPHPHSCTACDLDKENSPIRVSEILLGVPRLGPGEQE